MSDKIIKFAGMTIETKKLCEPLSILVSCPEQTSEDDFYCIVTFVSSVRKSQKIFGVDSGHCLKLALTYIEDIVMSPEQFLGGKVTPGEELDELPLIFVRR